MQIFSHSTSTQQQRYSQFLDNPKQPNIHPHHRYQSLLKYITSYIFDLKMILADLKQIIFSLVGINFSESTPPLIINRMARSRGSQNLSEKFGDIRKNRSNSLRIGKVQERVYSDKYCEIQFMMKNCSTAKNDLLKITSLIKGYQKGKYEICQNCQQQTQPIHKLPPKNSIPIPQKINPVKQINQFQQQSSQSFSERPSFPILSSCKSELDYDQIGFLTFRQMVDQQNSYQNKQTPKKIVKELTTQQWTNFQYNNNKQDDSKNKNTNHTNRNRKMFVASENLWEDSLQLIELMREELGIRAT